MWSEFRILGLAVERLTWLLNKEDGPYGILDLLRDKAGVKYNEFSARYGSNEVANAILCTWCLSVWIGLIVALISRKNVLYGLALSMEAIHRMEDK